MLKIIGSISFLAFIIFAITTIVFLIINRARAKNFAIYSLVSLAILIVVAVSQGKTSPSASQQGTATVAQQDDAKRAEVQQPQVQQAQPTSTPAASITAVELFEDYHANEVAADQKYKGKQLVVSGTIMSIRKDFTDNIILDLRTPNQFMFVGAYLDGGEASKAATLTKGGAITLECEGGGMVIGAPVLNDCTIKM